MIRLDEIHSKEFELGQKVKIKEEFIDDEGRTQWLTKVGNIIGIYPNLVRVNFGKYNRGINKVDFFIGDAEVV